MGGQEAFPAQQDAPLVDRVQTVHILERIDAVDQQVRVDTLGYGQLQDDAVHIRIGVEQVDAVADAALGLLGVEVGLDPVDDDLDPGFLARFSLAAHVAGRGGIVADQDDGQMRQQPADDHVFDLPRQRLADAGGDSRAVDDGGGHGVRVCGHGRMGCKADEGWGIHIS